MIPALSLHEPWAVLMAAGEKVVETRSYPPPPRHVGRRIAIHASKAVPAYALEACRESELRVALGRARAAGLFVCPARPEAERGSVPTCFRLPVGVVLCTVVLDGAVPTAEVRWVEDDEIEGHWERVGGPGSAVKVALRERPLGNYDATDARTRRRRWAWLTSGRVVIAQPYPEAKGRLGFWEWDGPVAVEAGGR